MTVWGISDGDVPTRPPARRIWFRWTVQHRHQRQKANEWQRERERREWFCFFFLFFCLFLLLLTIKKKKKKKKRRDAIHARQCATAETETVAVAVDFSPSVSKWLLPSGEAGPSSCYPLCLLPTAADVRSYANVNKRIGLCTLHNDLFRHQGGRGSKKRKRKRRRT